MLSGKAGRIGTFECKTEAMVEDRVEDMAARIAEMRDMLGTRDTPRDTSERSALMQVAWGMRRRRAGWGT